MYRFTLYHTFRKFCVYQSIASFASALWPAKLKSHTLQLCNWATTAKLKSHTLQLCNWATTKKLKSWYLLIGSNTDKLRYFLTRKTILKYGIFITSKWELWCVFLLRDQTGNVQGNFLIMNFWQEIFCLW